MVAWAVDPARLVFVDEMGANTSLSSIYAYAPKGERAYSSVPRNRGANTTLLSSMTLHGMGPSMAVLGFSIDFKIVNVVGGCRVLRSRAVRLATQVPQALAVRPALRLIAAGRHPAPATGFILG